MQRELPRNRELFWGLEIMDVGESYMGQIKWVKNADHRVSEHRMIFPGVYSNTKIDADEYVPINFCVLVKNKLLTVPVSFRQF